MILWQPVRRPLTPNNRQTQGPIRAWMTLGLVALGLSAVLHPRPWLVYNPSPSVPIGFYRVVAPTDLTVGDLVLVELPDRMRELADARRYVPASVPVLKHVAAQSGATVCADGQNISINGRIVGQRREIDRSGHPMPWWQGCRTLVANEVFLFNGTSPQSFDGRYFGVVKTPHVIGKAYPL